MATLYVHTLIDSPIDMRMHTPPPRCLAPPDDRRSECGCDDNSSSRELQPSTELARAAAQHLQQSPQTARSIAIHNERVECPHNTHQISDHPAAFAPATTPHTHNAAHRSPPRSSAPINHPAPAEPKQQPGARTRTKLTVHADRFREHRRKPAHTELRGDLWHPGELPRDRGMSQLGGIQVEHVSKR